MKPETFILYIILSFLCIRVSGQENSNYYYDIFNTDCVKLNNEYVSSVDSIELVIDNYLIQKNKTLNLSDTLFFIIERSYRDDYGHFILDSIFVIRHIANKSLLQTIKNSVSGFNFISNTSYINPVEGFSSQTQLISTNELRVNTEIAGLPIELGVVGSNLRINNQLNFVDFYIRIDPARLNTIDYRELAKNSTYEIDDLKLQNSSLDKKISDLELKLNDPNIKQSYIIDSIMYIKLNSIDSNQLTLEQQTQLLNYRSKIELHNRMNVELDSLIDKRNQINKRIVQSEQALRAKNIRQRNNLSKIKAFNVGKFSPFLSENSVNGISIFGFSTIVDTRLFEYSLLFGKNFTNFQSNPTELLGPTVLGTKLSYKRYSNMRIGLIFATSIIKLPTLTNRNDIYGIHNEHQIKSSLKISYGITYSNIITDSVESIVKTTGSITNNIHDKLSSFFRFVASSKSGSQFTFESMYFGKDFNNSMLTLYRRDQLRHIIIYTQPLKSLKANISIRLRFELNNFNSHVLDRQSINQIHIQLSKSLLKTLQLKYIYNYSITNDKNSDFTIHNTLHTFSISHNKKLRKLKVRSFTNLIISSSKTSYPTVYTIKNNNINFTNTLNQSVYKVNLMSQLTYITQTNLSNQINVSQVLSKSLGSFEPGIGYRYISNIPTMLYKSKLINLKYIKNKLNFQFDLELYDQTNTFENVNTSYKNKIRTSFTINFSL